MRVKSAPASPAFSLTEVVIALGVATVAVVSVLAIFPVGFDTARESEGDTQAAILARTIAADLAATVRKTGGSFQTAQVAVGKDLVNTNDWLDLNLAVASSNTIVYKRDIQTGEGGMIGNPYCLKPVRTLSPTAASAAVSDADFLATLAVTPQGSELSRLELAVEYPASVPQTNRFRQLYTWLMSP